MGKLTPRELEILGVLAEGKTNKQIAKKLKISEGTVKIHMHSIFRKTNTISRIALVLKVQKGELNVR